MARLLKSQGFQESARATDAEVIIVNTCGFISPARQESEQELQKAIRRKKPGQFVVAAGCLPQWQKSASLKPISGLDAMLGTREWATIANVLRRLGSHPVSLPSVPNLPDAEYRRVAIQGSSAYLKIADGCCRACAFCSIPLIKGPAVSRSMDEIVSDARFLEKKGVKEINLIAQDTTYYGHDLGLKDGLAKLLQKLTEEVPAVPWLRIMYAYPGYISERLMDLIASARQVLHYLDIPLQHAHPEILRKMKRPSDLDDFRKTVNRMRTSIPDLAIRSTFIVGFPGESDRHFSALLDFLSEMQFDRVGVFPYSFERGTPAEIYGDPISQDEKESRVEQLMLTQQEISLKRNKTLVGRTLDVLFEGSQEELFVGRSYRDAPEIDGFVFARGQAQVGEIMPVHVSSALVYDLAGEIVRG
jgi:ribosomal protein S12 methylthiotransferase